MSDIHIIHKKPVKMLRILYVIGFLFSAHLALTAYVNSTFLSEYLSENLVGLLFTASYIISVLSIVKIPQILNKIGSYKTVTLLTLINIGCLFGLFNLSFASLLIPVFIIYIASSNLIVFSLDIFVENFSEDKSTGRTRGLFLTIINIAWFLAPLLMGYILTQLGPEKIYIIGLLFVTPIYFIFLARFRKLKDPSYGKISIISAIKKITNNKDIRKIFKVNFLLEFFFACMVIYMPIYLNQYIGFSWNQIGIIFSIMLSPFVFLEWPLGKLADTRWGEKEILIIGFIIMGISTILIPFLKPAELILWALLLFMTRIGASSIQIMSDTYFFKKEGVGDTEVISLFRGNAMLAWVIAPLLASIFLFIFPLKYLFLALAIIVLLGIYFASTIKDTL